MVSDMEENVLICLQNCFDKTWNMTNLNLWMNNLTHWQPMKWTLVLGKFTEKKVSFNLKYFMTQLVDSPWVPKRKTHVEYKDIYLQVLLKCGPVNTNAWIWYPKVNTSKHLLVTDWPFNEESSWKKS